LFIFTLTLIIYRFIILKNDEVSKEWIIELRKEVSSVNNKEENEGEYVPSEKVYLFN
jgi:hypothetical protein